MRREGGRVENGVKGERDERHPEMHRPRRRVIRVVEEADELAVVIVSASSCVAVKRQTYVDMRQTGKEPNFFDHIVRLLGEILARRRRLYRDPLRRVWVVSKSRPKCLSYGRHRTLFDNDKVVVCVRIVVIAIIFAVAVFQLVHLGTSNCNKAK